MRHIYALFKKELKTYFNSPIAYIFITVFLILTSWLFFRGFFLENQATMRSFFGLLPWIFLFLVPAVTMRLWAEEKKMGTLEVLMTLPVKDGQAVVGKFLASFCFLAITLALSFVLPVIVAFLGKPDGGIIIGSYIGALLLAGAYLAVGLYISSLTDNQIVAFIIAVAVSFCFLIIGENFVVYALPSFVTPLFQYLGFARHFDSIARGVLDSRDLIFYFSIIGFFLFLNTRSLLKRKWDLKGSSNSAAVIALVLGILVMVNLFSTRLFGRFDLTEDKRYSVSEATKQMLEDLDDIVTVKAYFPLEKAPPQIQLLTNQVSDTLDEYQAYAKGNLRVKMLDPKKDPQLEQEVRSMGIPEIAVNVIEKDEAKVQNIYLGIAITYGDKKEVLPMVENTRSLEYDLTAAIRKVAAKELKKIGFLTGHGEHGIFEVMAYGADDGGKNDYTAVGKALQKNYQVQLVSTSEGEPIEDIDTLVVAGPEETLSERDLFEIDQFVMKGGTVIFLVDTVKLDQGLQASTLDVGLNELLNQWGVRVNTDLVVDRVNEMATFQMGYSTIMTNYVYWPKLLPENMATENPVTSSLESLVLPWSSSIELTETEGLAEGVILAKTTQFGATVSEPFDLNPNTPVNVAAENQKQQVMAVLLTGKLTSLFADKEVPKIVEEEVGGEEEDTGLAEISLPAEEAETEENESRDIVKESPENSRIFVMGDSDFMGDGFIGRFPQNGEFFLNVVDYLTLDETLIGIRAKGLIDRPLKEITEMQKSVTKVLGTIGIPILVVIFGLVKAFLRKRKRTLSLL